MASVNPDRSVVHLPVEPIRSEPDEPAEPTLADYLSILLRRRRTLAVTALLVIVATVIVTGLQEPVYRASTDVVIRTTSSQRLFAGTGPAAQALLRSTSTELTFIDSDVYRDAVSSDPALPPGAEFFVDMDQDDFSGGDDGVLTFVGRAGSASAAQAAAEVAAATYIDLRRGQDVEAHQANLAEIEERLDTAQRDLETFLAPLDEIDRLLDETEDADEIAALLRERSRTELTLGTDLARLNSDVDALIGQRDRALETGELVADPDAGAFVNARAQRPDGPVSPNWVRNLLLGAVLALIVGVGVALVHESLDDAISDEAQLERALGAPVLATVPAVTRIANPFAQGATLDPALIDGFRAVRTSLGFVLAERPARVILVTSAVAGEGKTTASIHLAHSLALQGRSVALVDADLRNPSLSRLLGIAPDEAGLSDALIGEPAELIGVSEAVWLCPAGQRVTAPAELVGRPQLGQLLDDLSGQFDLVLVDCSPLLPVPEARLVASNCDAVILVANAGRGGRRKVRSAATLLERSRCRVLGGVLNQVETGANPYGYGSYGDQARGARWWQRWRR